MKTAGSSETLEFMRQTTRRHIPGGNILKKYYSRIQSMLNLKLFL
jgi:hypothetical protein